MARLWGAEDGGTPAACGPGTLAVRAAGRGPGSAGRGSAGCERGGPSGTPARRAAPVPWTAWWPSGGAQRPAPQHLARAWSPRRALKRAAAAARGRGPAGSYSLPGRCATRRRLMRTRLPGPQALRGPVGGEQLPVADQVDDYLGCCPAGGGAAVAYRDAGLVEDVAPVHQPGGAAVLVDLAEAADALPGEPVRLRSTSGAVESRALRARRRWTASRQGRSDRQFTIVVRVRDAPTLYLSSCPVAGR